MRVAVVGGGINGVMCAWELAKRGCDVVLFERSATMNETSRASTKLLHGGLRYLEHGSIGLVRESLREREWWMAQAPELARPLRFIIPVYRELSRSSLMLRIGLMAYDALAGSKSLERHRRLTAEQVVQMGKGLRPESLQGGYTYTDAQMDDYALGVWAAEKARGAGVNIRENCHVQSVSVNGEVRVDDGVEVYDRIVNAAGPWAGQLLEKSGVASCYQLRLVRGSHLVVNRTLDNAVLMQVPEDKRVVFAIPWKQKVLLGTTEVEQAEPQDTECTVDESNYLCSIWKRYFKDELKEDEIVERFAGVRPLLRKQGQVSTNSRESALERKEKLITVYGGKWTTARLLGRRAAALAQA